MKLRKRLLASLLTLTLVVPLFSAAATAGTVQAEDNTITLAANESQVLFDESNEESARYAVLSGNVKIKANSFPEESYKNVQFLVTSEPSPFAQFQVLNLNDAEKWTVKVPSDRGNSNDETANEDGVKVGQNQSQDSLLADVKGASGIDFKIVRLDGWAYFLVKDVKDKDSGYILAGRMYGLKGKNTKFTISSAGLASGDTVELSNYTVTTGKENALAALAGSKFTVEDTSGGTDLSNVDNSVYFPVESTEWTVEARVSLPNYDTIATSEEYRSMHVGPGAGSFNKSAWEYGMGINHSTSGEWLVQRLSFDANGWSEKTIEEAHAKRLDPYNGGMWIRWVRSGSVLSVYTSADGNAWTYVHRRTDLGEMDPSATGIYIDADKKTDLTDIKITLKGSIIIQKKDDSRDLCVATNEKYAVLSGNVSLETTDSNVQFYVTPEHTGAFSQFQVRYQSVSSNWVMEVNNNDNRKTDDGVILEQSQSNEEGLLANINAGGLDFKIVRLDDWAYFLVKDTAGGYKLVGKMNGLKGKATKFTISTGSLGTGDVVELPNYTVTTGKENAIAALTGSKFSVNGEGTSSNSKDATYFPLDSTVWTFEAKVKTSIASGAAVYVGPGPKGEDSADSTGNYSISTGWKHGLGVVKTAEGNWIIKQPMEGDTSGKTIESYATNLTTGGLYVRWVRNYAELFAYVSTDGTVWEPVVKRTDLNSIDATGLFVNGLASTELSDIKITLEGGDITQQGKHQEKSVLCAKTTEKYAVLSGNVKFYSENKQDKANVQFHITSNDDFQFSQFQVLWYENTWYVKVVDKRNYNDTSADVDGVKLEMLQSEGEELLGNIEKAIGLDFKIVRLGDWAYFLVKDTGNGYKLVGQMYGLGEEDTQFTMSHDDFANEDVPSVKLSNYTVTTGKENAVAALAESKFSVAGTGSSSSSEDSIYFPLNSREWTFEAKVKTSNDLPSTGVEGTTSKTAVYVGPGPRGNDQYTTKEETKEGTVDGCKSYGKSTGFMYGLGVVRVDESGEWIIKEPLNIDASGTSINDYAGKLTSDEGLYVRWVRSYAELSAYVSTDRENWSFVAKRTGLDDIKNSEETVDATGLFINGMQADLSEIKIYLAKGVVGGAAASLGDMITMNFCMTFPEETLADTKAKINYTLPDMNKTKGSFLVKDLTESTYNGVAYKVFSLNVAAKEMASDIKFRVVSGDGSYGEEFKYNVKTYAKAIIDGKAISNSTSEAYNNAVIKMAKAMLNYGARAQTYFNFNTGNLANAVDNMTEEDKKLTDPDFTGMEITPSSSISSEWGLKYYGTSLLTTSATTICHYFTLSNGEDIKNYTFKCGTTKLNPVHKKDNLYYVDITGITATQLRNSFTLEISKDGDENSGTVVYSPYTYVKRTLTSSNTKLVELVKAMYHYGEAAYTLNITQK